MFTRAAKPTTLQLTARRILAKQASTLPVGVAATQATLTAGASGAVSTINGASVNLGAQTDSFISPRLSDVSGTWGLDVNAPTSGYIGTHIYRSATQRIGCQGQGKRFFFDGQKFDICLYNMTATIVATDLSTGIRASYSSDQAGVANFAYLLVDFGSRANRIVEVYLDGSNVSGWARGFNFLVTDSVGPFFDPSETRFMMFGDSYTAGTNNGTMRTALGHVIGETIGARNTILSGRSGTGVLGLSGASWATRAITDFSPSYVSFVDLIFAFAASLNDNSGTDPNVQAGVAGWLSPAMAAQPNAIFMLAGPQFCSSVQTSPTRYAAVKASVLSASNNDPRVVYIDNGPTTSITDKWQYGTGNTGSTTGNGNNDNYIETAGVHLTATGNVNVGRAIGRSILNNLRALA